MGRELRMMLKWRAENPEREWDMGEVSEVHPGLHEECERDV